MKVKMSLSPHTSIDFRLLRSHRGSQETGFEELLRQLLLANPPRNLERLEHKGRGADGGVEVLAHLSDGTAIGYQAKYFVGDFGPSQISQIRSSFDAAFAAYPNLREFVVALPRNLSSGTALKTQRKAWDNFVTTAQQKAEATGRSVQITLWDETMLLGLLQRRDAIHAGIRHYWFNQNSFTDAWFHRQFTTTVADLGERYLPEDHVDVSAQRTLDILVSGPSWRESVEQFPKCLDEAIAALKSLQASSESLLPNYPWAEGLAELHAVQVAFDDVDWLSNTRKDPERVSQAVKCVSSSSAYHAFEVLTQPDRISDESFGEVEVRNYHASKYEEKIYDLSKRFRAFDDRLVKEATLLVLGEAGAGKSHSLAALTESVLSQGGAALLFLGQHFSGEPRQQILARLGLSWGDFDEFLACLHAASLATGTRGLIIIDGLNESRENSQWSQTIAGLASHIASFSTLALVISCRDTYVAKCLPKNWSVARLRHTGFEGDAAQAAKTYLDRHGIDRPATPFLDPMFTNPLVLSTSVRSLVRLGRRSFPVGVEGVSTLFNFWLDSVETNLVQKGYERIVSGDGRLRRAVRKFAERLAQDGVDRLPFDLARDLIEAEVAPFGLRGPHDELIWRLIDEGIFRREPISGTDNEAVVFTFQRFSDHFVAAAILRSAHNLDMLRSSLDRGGAYSYVLKEHGWRFDGVVEALMAQVPQKFSVELVDVIDAKSSRHILPQAFLQSLRWRVPSAVTARAVGLYERILAEWDEEGSPAAALLFQVATVPGHPLNADYLHSRLLPLKMAKRDSEWASMLLWSYEDDDAPIRVLIDWALSARTDLAEPDRARLLTVTLSWLFISSVRPIRDQATKALAAGFWRNPRLISEHIKAFSEVNDPYVRERVLAAAAGAACYLDRFPQEVSRAALAAYNAVFNKTEVEWHAFVRQFAFRLIEIASSRKILPGDISLDRCRPPYTSKVVEHWPSASDVRMKKDAALSIIRSTVGHLPENDVYDMAGDFGRYTMGSISVHFAADPQASGAPRTHGQRRDKLWKDICAVSPSVASLAQTAISAFEAKEKADSGQWRSWEAARQFGAQDELAEARLREKRESLEAAFKEADALLQAALPAELKFASQYTAYVRHNDDSAVMISQHACQLWVADRAINLGWSKQLHEHVERNLHPSAGRMDHAIERIGKKYQWIAFHELIGILQDHYWYCDDGCDPAVLKDLSIIERMNIDPSYFEPFDSKLLGNLPELGLPPTDFAQDTSVDEALAWAGSFDDLPDPCSNAVQTDASGISWWLAKAFVSDKGYIEKEQVDGAVRTGQSAIDLILVPQRNVRALHDRWKNSKLNTNEMQDRRDYPDLMFGELRHEVLSSRPDGSIKSIGRHNPFLRGFRHFDPNCGGYDHSGTEERGFLVPEFWLISEARLKPAGPGHPWFVDEEGDTVFLDPAPLPDRAGQAMFRADKIIPILQTKALVPAWIFWAEKDGGAGAGKGFTRREFANFRRETFSGLWWLEGDQWNGSTWLAR